MNRSQLAEKRYRDENYNNQLPKTKLQNKKQHELNKKTIFREQNELKKEIKQYERKQKKDNIRDVNIDFSRFFELATTNRMYVNSLNLHEVKNEPLLDYKGDFKLNGFMLIGEIEQKTYNRFKNIDDLQTYNNAIDNNGYDSDEVVFTGWL